MWLWKALENLPLGRWFGIPVYLHFTWWIVFFSQLNHSYTAALTYLCMFLIVILHELGHCFAGRALGCEIQGILLSPLGGLASLEIPERPRDEFLFTTAGPMVNVIFIPILWIASAFYPFFYTVFVFNIVMIFYNLLPGFPMDGGRLLRCTLSYFSGDHVWATWLATRIGQGTAISFVIVGIATPLPMLAIMGALLLWLSQSEYELVLKKQCRKQAVSVY